MNLNPIDLASLNFTMAEIAGLTEEKQRKIIRKRWGELCVQHHPDKNGGRRDQFERVMAAYDNIFKSTAEAGDYKLDMNNYFKPTTITIPETAFDLLMQEDIQASYEELKKQFRTLNTEEDKKTFGQHYGSFLNLAQHVEKMQKTLNEKRVDAMAKADNASVYEVYIREWRKLIIRILGEEYLDGFQYREALATGDLWPVLATRKLLSPVKLLVISLNSLSLVGTTLASYFGIQVITGVMMNFMAVFNDGSMQSAGELVMLATKMGLLITALILPFYLSYNLAMVAFYMPTIASFLETLASPVNKLVRPVAEFMGVHPFVITVLFFTFAVGAVCALSAGVATGGSIELLLYVTAALSLYSFYLMGKIILKMYEISPAFGVFQGILIVGCTILGLLLPDSGQALDPLLSFFYAISNVCMLYYSDAMLENINLLTIEKMEVLPLPEETIPDSDIKMSLIGQQRALHSHRFFNTPKEASYLVKEERTLWQQTASFFGGGAKTATFDRPAVQPQLQQIEYSPAM